MNDIKQFLRSNALRPTKQRIVIAGYLFDGTDKHVTAESLSTELAKRKHIISLATIYNTVHAFKDKGYLKEISINSDKSYFDTNITNHHHFFDEDTNQLIDCNNEDIEEIKIKKNITEKKIKSVEVLIKVASANKNQN